MENQTPEKVEPVVAAPVAPAKKTRLSNRTKNRMMFGVAVVAVALLAYNGGYLQKAGTKAQEAIAAITPASFSFGTAAKAEDKLKLYRHSVTWKGKVPEAVKAEPENIAFPADEPLKQECRHFLDCCAGKLKPRETVAQGIAAAPEAFLGLLKGKNLGKQLVKLV